MAVFSFVMVIVISSFTQIIRSYRKGVVSQRTQEATREIVNLISKEARGSGEIKEATVTVGGATVKLLCLRVAHNFSMMAHL